MDREQYPMNFTKGWVIINWNTPATAKIVIYIYIYIYISIYLASRRVKASDGMEICNNLRALSVSQLSGITTMTKFNTIFMIRLGCTTSMITKLDYASDEM